MDRGPTTEDRHALYEAAVQSVEADIAFVRRVYRGRNGSDPKLLREDFCGTASMACRWAALSDAHRAFGVDLDDDTLAWGRRHRLAPIGDAAERATLVRGDVLDVVLPPVDVAVALNFSYSVFKQRPVLVDYLRKVRRSLRPGGIFVLDLFGGTAATNDGIERHRKPGGVQPDGRRVRPFTYVWEQTRYNPLDAAFVCYISFVLAGGRTLRRVFRYDWRLWTVPELRDAMADAGFASAEPYVEGWDDDKNEATGVFRRRARFENQDSWIAYVVGFA